MLIYKRFIIFITFIVMTSFSRVCPMAESKKAMSILVAVIGSAGGDIKHLAESAAVHLEKGSQFDVSIQSLPKQPETNAEIEKLFEEGFLIVIFLKWSQEKDFLEWRIYEKIYKNGKLEIRMDNGQKMFNPSSYRLADSLWQALKAQKSCFSSKLAWIKRSKNKFGKTISDIIVADYEGLNKKCISSINGVYVGLSWSPENGRASLYCSEFQFANVKLNHIFLTGIKHVVVDRAGTCIGVSIGADGNRAIYGLSGSIWSCEYDEKSKKSIHKCIINNTGNNFSAKIVSDSKILYCTDNSGFPGPQICMFNILNKSVENITDSGYCVGPAYSPINNKIAYSKRVDDYMQLFVYDMKRAVHTQISFDSADKIDCCWSSCGRYLIFCYQNKNISKIGIINVNLSLKENVVFVTSDDEYCCCPSWSPNFINLL